MTKWMAAGFAGLLLWATFPAPALVKPIKDVADHPIVSRYPGSEMVYHEARDYDEVTLLQKKIDRHGSLKDSPGAALRLEGRITRNAYRAPEGKSTLEVFLNYEQALEGAGFETLFECTNEGCGAYFGRALELGPLATRMAYNGKDQRYLLSRRKTAAGDVHVAVFISRAYGSGGPDKDRVFTRVDVVESAVMQTGLVKVDAAAMSKGLLAEGHVALYGIYFDTNKDEVKPESEPALREIARLMQSNPSLELLVVGHTDNVGSLEMNQELSERRAESVVEALVDRHNVAKDRLTPAGAGMLAPVASNDLEQGRAKNRRVELVKFR